MAVIIAVLAITLCLVVPVFIVRFIILKMDAVDVQCVTKSQEDID